MDYDSLGRKIALDDPDLSSPPGHWTYTYDAAGNLATQTDARGQIIGFDYDALNRLIVKDYRQRPGLRLRAEAVYHYDDTSGGNAGLGRRTGMIDFSATRPGPMTQLAG